jgi:hypothetical protein
VGKGQGLRFWSHGQAVPDTLDEDEGTKVARIRSIRASGSELEIWVLRYGLSAAEYTAVEGAVIDLLTSFPIERAPVGRSHRPFENPSSLTNMRRELARGHGLVLLGRLIDDYAAPSLTTTEPLLLITMGLREPLEGEVIAGGRRRYVAGFKRAWYEPALRDSEVDLIGESISAWWKVSPRTIKRHGIDHAVAVYRGVTRGLFRIIPDSWEQNEEGRWGLWFESITSDALYDEVVGPHGHRVPRKSKGAQNPLYYWPRN